MFAIGHTNRVWVKKHIIYIYYGQSKYVFRFFSNSIIPFIPAKIYTFEDLNPHAKGVLFISFKGNVADK